MKTNTHAKLQFVVAAASLVLAGCATGGSTSLTQQAEDPHAAARSQAYMDGVTYVTQGSRLSDSSPCVAPADLDKTFGKGSGNGPSKGWRDLIGRANTCVNEKNWRVLETIANAMARIDIDSPWGMYYLGLAAEAQGEYSRALWMTEQALRKAGGKSPLYTYQRGHVLLKMGETVKAMDEFKKAVGMDPRLNEAHLFLAEIHHRDLEFDKADVHYKAALENEPKNYRALVGFAETRLQAGAAEEAVVLYNKAQSVDSKQIRPWLRTAYIYENVLKNDELALNSYKGLRSAIDNKTKLDFDLGAKIKALEDAIRVARMPAQTPTTQKDEVKVGQKTEPKAEPKNVPKSQQRSVK